MHLKVKLCLQYILNLTMDTCIHITEMLWRCHAVVRSIGVLYSLLWSQHEATFSCGVVNVKVILKFSPHCHFLWKVLHKPLTWSDFRHSLSVCLEYVGNIKYTNVCTTVYFFLICSSCVELKILYLIYLLYFIVFKDNSLCRQQYTYTYSNTTHMKHTFIINLKTWLQQV